jgi:hypothetical protein
VVAQRHCKLVPRWQQTHVKAMIPDPVEVR